MGAELTLAAFAAQLHTNFQVKRDGAPPVQIELATVIRKAASAPEQFTLLFRSESNVFLPQATYQMEQAELGQLALFIVPVNDDQLGYTYEAVINRLAGG